MIWRFVHATPLKRLDGFQWNFSGMISMECKFAYCIHAGLWIISLELLPFVAKITYHLLWHFTGLFWWDIWRLSEIKLLSCCSVVYIVTFCQHTWVVYGTLWWHTWMEHNEMKWDSFSLFWIVYMCVTKLVCMSLKCLLNFNDWFDLYEMYRWISCHHPDLINTFRVIAPFDWWGHGGDICFC